VLILAGRNKETINPGNLWVNISFPRFLLESIFINFNSFVLLLFPLFPDGLGY